MPRKCLRDVSLLCDDASFPLVVEYAKSEKFKEWRTLGSRTVEIDNMNNTEFAKMMKEAFRACWIINMEISAD